MKIVIDPGHRNNKWDFGATNGVCRESEIALSISKKLKKELEKHNIICYMTRNSEDDVVSLTDRCKLANTLKSDLFISVHINAYSNKNSAGIVTLYYDADTLAKSITDNMVSFTGAPSRGISQRKDLWVLNSTNMTAVLLECGFITNDIELKLLLTDDYQNKLVKGAVKAIVEKYKIVVPEPTKRVATVTVDSLNMRLEPNTTSAIKGMLKRGDRITIFETKNGWAKSYGYWVSESYLQYDNAPKPETEDYPIKCKPLDLKLQIGKKQYTLNSDNGINGTYFWYLDKAKTKTYPTSILFYNGKCYHAEANHAPSPQTVMVVYKDGAVECKQIKNIKEIDTSKCHLVIGGMGLNNYNDHKLEGFVGAYADVTRQCNKPFMAYKDGYIYLGIKKNATHSDMVALSEQYKYVMQLDGGGSCLMKKNGKVLQNTDGRLINNFIYI